MIEFSSKYRSQQKEIMDDLELRGDEMKELLHDLRRVNKWLGGNKITMDGIEKLLKTNVQEETITILDIGCGDGAMLRECVQFFRRSNLKIKGIGLDANSFIVEEAKNRSKDFKELSFIEGNIFSEEIEIPKHHIALYTLFMHHFQDEEIEAMLSKVLDKAKVGAVVNDLHRSRLAYYLFKMMSRIFLKTKIARFDGLVSIARGFKKSELIRLSEKIKNTNSQINWKWAFRYQWVLRKE